MNEIIKSTRAAGIAWADREAEALVDELPAGSWQGSTVDAKALMPDIEDDGTAEAWLVECVAAARAQWDAIVEAAECDADAGEKPKTIRRVSLPETWHIPPEREGQHVEYSYGIGEDGIPFRRELDRSDNSVRYHMAPSVREGWEPWNTEPTGYEWTAVTVM